MSDTKAQENPAVQFYLYSPLMAAVSLYWSGETPV